MASCSLCLELDIEVSMYEETDAFMHFQEILIKQGFEPLNSHSTICFLCKHLVYKYFSFMKRILRAQTVMRDVMKKHKSAKITYDTMKNLNRSDLNLSLNLSYHNIPSFYIGIKKVKKEDGNDTFKSEYEIFQSEYEISTTDLNIKEEYDLNYETELEKNPSKNNNKRSQHNKKNKAKTRYKATPVDLEDYNVSNESEYEVNPADLETMKEESHIHYELVLEKKTENKENQEKSHNQKKKPKPKYKFKPMPVEIMPTKLRRKQTPKPSITEVTESDETENEETKPDDDEYIPDKLESESEEISENEICYDDNGKRIKKEVKRQYPMECEECEYEIPSALKHFHHYLVNHRDKDYPYKRPGEFVCQHCGVTKTTEQHLRNHEAVHGVRKIECDFCGKKFHSMMRMRRHRINHSETYRFICDYCNKGFHFKSDFLIHIRIHTGEKPFKCHICGAGFAHKGNVGIHIRMSHQGIPMKINTKKKSVKRKNTKKTSTKPKKKRKVRKSNKSDTSDSD